MKKIKQILVLGYFGNQNNQLDGQTVKTRAIYDLLRAKTDNNVVYADTQEFRINKRSIFKFIKDVFRSDNVVILPCSNNLKLIFPFLFFICKIFRINILHIGIGGWHKEFLKAHSLIRWMLKHIQINLLENTLTCEELSETFGFSNISVIPNFRIDEPTKPIKADNEVLRAVFMARVNVKKGLDTLSSLSDRIEKSALNGKIIIDIYGPIQSELDNTYLKENLVDKFRFVNYGGCLKPDEIFKELSQYDVMLFPTHYFTEGFPGSILDAFRAGVPVIATAWKHSAQFIIDGYNGFIVDFDNPVQEIIDKLEILSNNKKLLSKMQECAYDDSFNYTAQKAWTILNKYLN